jgi:aspartyl-tRNA(Asn)/glutamyl-tRNA(Gln) amidotransferase subunit A
MNIVSKPATIDLTTSEMAAAIASTWLSPVAAVEAALVRIDQLDPVLRAWAYIDREGARETAKAMEAEAKAGKMRGPLHGVPVGIKDVFHAAGMPTIANSRTSDPNARYPDSPVVAALRRAGAIILGKCTTVEFAGAGVVPETRNPWNTDHTPGGSSSGSGAAVGARMVPMAIGTQTGGSTLRPAAYCGVAGFKPSYGALSRKGMYPLAWSLDHPGIIARSAADLSVVYRAIAKQLPTEVASDRAWRVGLLRPFFMERSDEPTVKAVEKAAKLFAEAGAIISEPPLPAGFEALPSAHKLILSIESSTFHASRLANHPDTISLKTRSTIQAYSLVPAIYYLQAHRIRHVLREELLKLFRTLDILIMPTTPAPPPAGIESTGDASFLSPWSHVGFPSATIPCGVSQDKLPIGLQIVGPPNGEGTVLAMAEFGERLLGRLSLPA